MNFLLTLTTVGILLLYAVPGVILSKAKAVTKENLPALSKILLYVCQPCLTLYTFNDADFTPKLFQNMGIFFLVITILQLLMMGGIWFILGKKREEVRYRIATVACTFGNCAFFGVPILESLLPGTDAVVFTNMYAVSMNLLGWTVASAIVAKDKKYISVKKIFLNPAVLSVLVALPLFVCKVKLPMQLYGALSLLGKMTTPLCMLILGIRLGQRKIKDVFSGGYKYLVVVIKQMLFPLLVLGIASLLPWEEYIRQTIFILACCPIASVVLMFSELVGTGQDDAADLLLLGTALCILTMPVMLLIL